MRQIPVSQYVSDEIGIAIYEQGELADADAGVTLGIVRDGDQAVIVAAGTAATHDGTGLYSYRLTSAQTQIKGPYTATWSYDVNTEDFTFQTHYVVVDPAPNWDALDANQRTVAENVYFRVSDGFDSSLDNGGGGPYLWELPQAQFGYETIARLMRTEAISYINFSKPKDFSPPFAVGKNAPNPFPVAYYGLLEKATFWCLVKHLARSYLEQPLAVNVPTARLDRRDYFDRWNYVAQMEKDDLDQEIRMLKRRYLYGVRTRASLLAGGIFPISYLDPSRPRWPYIIARF